MEAARGQKHPLEAKNGMKESIYGKKCWMKVHCWKKKRDFRIIRSKVGRLVTRSVADNEYFVCWKDKMVYKYHQK